MACTELLLRHNADIDAQDARGNTALHVAAKWGDVDIVRVLLRNNASLTLKNRAERTPLEVRRRRSAERRLACLWWADGARHSSFFYTGLGNQPHKNSQPD